MQKRKKRSRPSRANHLPDHRSQGEQASSLQIKDVDSLIEPSWAIGGAVLARRRERQRIKTMTVASIRKRAASNASLPAVGGRFRVKRLSAPKSRARRASVTFATRILPQPLVHEPRRFAVQFPIRSIDSGDEQHQQTPGERFHFRLPRGAGLEPAPLGFTGLAQRSCTERSRQISPRPPFRRLCRRLR